MTGLGAGRGTRQLQDALLAEILAELRSERANSTEAFAQFRSSITNDVLDSGAYMLDASGLATASYKTPYGSVFVTNYSNEQVIVTSSPPATSAPTRGRGVHIVPAYSAAVLNLAGTAWTIYGTAGDYVGVQAFTRPQPPAAAGRVAGVAAPVMAITTSSNPVAGAELFVTVPAGETWRLVSARVTLVTDATVGDRRVNVAVDDGSLQVARIPASAVQPASTTTAYTVAAGVSGSSATDLVVPLPAGLVLGPGYRLRTVTDGIQPGDNYGTANVLYERL